MELSMRTEMRRDPVTQTVGHGYEEELVYAIGIEDPHTRDNVSIHFSPSGEVSEIVISGYTLLGKEGSKKEVLVMDESEQRGVQVLSGDELNKPEVRAFVEGIFGMSIPAEKPIQISKTATLQNLIKNIDSKSPEDPRNAVIFIECKRDQGTGGDSRLSFLQYPFRLANKFTK